MTDQATDGRTADRSQGTAPCEHGTRHAPDSGACGSTLLAMGHACAPGQAECGQDASGKQCSDEGLAVHGNAPVVQEHLTIRMTLAQVC
jgi:hypothetical protein